MLLGSIFRLSGLSLGPTVETDLWTRFATEIANYGLAWTYRFDADFNHPAVAGYGALGLLHLSEVFSIRFESLLRTFSIVCDLLLLFILSLRSSAQGMMSGALYCCALTPLLVAGYFGNSDTICLLLIVLSCFCYESNRPLLSGILLGFATNIKIIPVILVPAFILCAVETKIRLRLYGGLLLGFVPHLITLFTTGLYFVHKVLLYQPVLSVRWGIQAFLLPEGGLPTNYAQFYAAIGTYVMVAVILLTCIIQLRRRHLSLAEHCALIFLLFVTFAPSLFVHYLAYPTVALFLIAPSIAAVYSIVSGVVLLPVFCLTNNLAVEGLARWELLSSCAAPLAWALGLYCMVTLVYKLLGRSSKIFRLGEPVNN